MHNSGGIEVELNLEPSTVMAKVVGPILLHTTQQFDQATHPRHLLQVPTPRRPGLADATFQ